MGKQVMIILLIVVISLLQTCRGQEVRPIVCLHHHNRCLIGKQMIDLDGISFESYLGIPFAQPPIGRLRFANPVRHKGWQGMYNATIPKSVCMQLDSLHGVIGSEDCLYLNVYRPKHFKAPLPVIVFVHGGSFIYGSALPSVYGPEKFMSNGSIILVTMQYRLGALGFLSTGDCDAPGNVGLKDQHLALEWVKEHIKRFGGDPELITLVGESAGGISVQLHMVSPRSKGLFQRAIMMSGSALIHTIDPPDMGIRLARYQLAAIGLDSAGEMTPEQVLLILRSTDAAAIVGSILKVKQMYNPNEVFSVFRPTLEVCNNNETFINRPPSELWRNGEYTQIPWMAGFVQNEGTVITLEVLNNAASLGYFKANAPTLIPKILGVNSKAAPALKARFFGGPFTPNWITESNGQLFTDMMGEASFTYPFQCSARLHLSRGKGQPPVSLYYFNFMGPYSYCSLYAPKSRQNYGVCHGDDLMYIFRQPAVFPDFEANSTEARMSRTLVNYFVEFAYNGVVQSKKGCTSLNSCKMVEFKNFDESCNWCSSEKALVDAFDLDMMHFWNELYNETCQL